jgi:hypothetical protein
VPPTPPIHRWEWKPYEFDVERHGRFYDWFLIRSRPSPARRFEAAPSIELVAQHGSWWLFKRANR